MKIAAIILAAGASSRMGKNKLLLPFGGGNVLDSVISTALHGGFSQVILILGHESEKFSYLRKQKDLTVGYNKNYCQGQGTSLARGAELLKEDMDGVCIFMGDQPLVQNETVQALHDKFAELEDNQAIVVPVKGDKRGNPVIMGKAYFSRLRELNEDMGARKILAENTDKINMVEVEDEGVFLDVDNPLRYHEAIDKKNAHRREDNAGSDKRSGRPC